MSTDTVVDRLALALLHFTWQGTAVAGGLVLLTLLFGVRQPSGRYALSLFALLVMAACPVVTFVALSPARTGHASEFADASRIDEPIVPALKPLNAAPQPPIVTDPSPAKPWWPIGQMGIVLAWMTGVSLLGVRLLFGWIYLQRLRGSCLPVPAEIIRQAERLCHLLSLRVPRVGCSPSISELIATGLVRPTSARTIQRPLLGFSR